MQQKNLGMASIRSGIGESMEDRYLFKAKHIHTLKNNSHLDGIWVKGYLVDENYIASIEDGYEYLIDPETICQCTGLKDKNGELIWENDIVRDKEGNCYKAFWQNNYYQFSWICVKSDIFQIGTKWDLYIWRSYEIAVIGNTFDNPELLESEE